MTVALVRIGDVLQQVTRAIPVNVLATYKTMGVRSFGRGAFMAPELEGQKTKYSTLRRVEKDDLVYPKLMAWEGAFAVVPAELDGYMVSPEFCTFVADTDRLTVGYMRHLFAWPDFVQRLSQNATGTNVRRQRLQPKQLLEAQIPLPTIGDQRVISARLDRIAAATSSSLANSTSLSELSASISASWNSQVSDYKPLGDYAKITRGTTLKLDPESSIGAIGQAAVRWRILRPLLKGVDKSWADRLPAKSLSRPGELLVNSTGDGTIGRGALVDESTSGLLIDSHVLRVSTADPYDAEFVMLFLWSAAGRAAIASLKGSTTTKQTELGILRLGQLPIPHLDRAGRDRYRREFRYLLDTTTEYDLAQSRFRALQSALPQAARNAEFARLMS